MDYICHLLIYLSIYAILAMSLNLVVGCAGMLTLAHSAYFAIGAYAYALCAMKLGLTFLPAVALAMLIAGLLSLTLSLPSWRMKGDFFVLVSLAIQAVLLNVIRNWGDARSPLGTLGNLTNGPFGIPGVPKPALFGAAWSTTPSIAALAAACAVLTIVICWRLQASPWGRLLKSMRDDELATRSLGKNTRLMKLEVFAISCAFAGLAGSLYVGYVSYIDPSSASLDESILMLAMVLVGGVGNFRGPLVGAAVLVAVPEVLRFLALPETVGPNIRLLAYALMLVLLVHIRPQGLAGAYKIR